MTDSPSIVVRFAPSPTGYLHIGNIRTALLNWLFSRSDNNTGKFILRLDDTDVERSTSEYADAIIEDLDWLGLPPDETHRQSDRLSSYDSAAERLRSAGLLYACYETPEEIDRRRKRLRSRGLPPVYDRSALRLTDAEKASLEQEGRTPHWRFLLPNHKNSPFEPERTEVSWRDMVRGDQTVDLSSLSDPVLIRADGSYLYTLPSIVDDLDMGVTHLIRGADHITNTGVQISLFEALGGTAPTFGHHNLLIDSSGEGLSKRKGDLSVRSLRERGIESVSILALSGLLGTSHSIPHVIDLGVLLEMFDISSISSSPARFSVDELDSLNSRILHNLPYLSVREQLASLDSDLGESFWVSVRGNIATLSDITIWRDIVTGEFESIPPDDDSLIEVAMKHLPAGEFDDSTWSAWTKSISEETGLKGKGLYLPLRRLLTGRDDGPDLGEFLPILGRERVLARLG